MDYQLDLKEKGYCIIENILTEEELQNALNYFYDWINSNPQIKNLHNTISPHGIFKHFEVGHQRHAWYIRTIKSVQDVFKKLWNTNDLAVSYDGCCWLSKDLKKSDNIWTHADQSPKKIGLHCYQGFVSLTNNKNRSFVVYEGSHLLHEKYCKDKKIDHNKDWMLIDHDYLKSIENTKKVLDVKAGSLVIWDSRTFHQNQYGLIPEDRIVQYVSFLPKNGMSKKIRDKRLKYFETRRTTSHWAYPVKVNGLQPQRYGNDNLFINYKELKIPYLDDLIPDIMKLI